jgi:nitrite reductase/ring-hydroxylating ferredoxin subunit
MQTGLYICEVHEVGDPGCHEFRVRTRHGDIEGFVVHWRGSWFAYRNQCPHTGVSLNWQPHQFFDYQQRLLQCALHGALFEPDTGLCIHGPCLGDSLHPLPVIRTGTSLRLTGESIEGILQQTVRHRPKSV